MSADPESFYQLLSGRHSIRRFRPDPIPEETLKRTLRMACRAPSAHNRQPWRFVIVGQTGQRKELVDRMTARWRSDLEADGMDEAGIEKLLWRNQERLLAPPIVIFVCMTMEDMDSYSDQLRRSAERTMAVQSVAMAGAYLLLAAHAEGLGACWICAPLFVPDLIRECLELPASWEAQGAVALGYPADGGLRRNRRPLEEVTFWT